MTPAETAAALRARLRWRQASIGQGAALPSPESVQLFAVQLEALRRLDAAIAAGDAGRMRKVVPIAEKALYAG